MWPAGPACGPFVILGSMSRDEEPSKRLPPRISSPRDDYHQLAGREFDHRQPSSCALLSSRRSGYGCAVPRFLAVTGSSVACSGQQGSPGPLNRISRALDAGGRALSGGRAGVLSRNPRQTPLGELRAAVDNLTWPCSAICFACRYLASPVHEPPVLTIRSRGVLLDE